MRSIGVSRYTYDILVPVTSYMYLRITWGWRMGPLVACVYGADKSLPLHNTRYKIVICVAKQCLDGIKVETIAFI